MEVLIVLAVIACTVSLIGFLLKLTLSVSVSDPKFALKAFATGLAGSVAGYLAEGRVEIKVVLWGIGGVILYAAYKYVFDQA